MKWEEREHPRNPDGTFRDKHGADWATKISGMFRQYQEPDEHAEARMLPPISGEDRHYTDAEFLENWVGELDEGEDLDDYIESSHEFEGDGGQDLRVMRMADQYETRLLVSPTETGWHVIDTWNADEAAAQERELDYLDMPDRDLAQYTHPDEYGFVTSIRRWNRITGRRADGSFGMVQITEHGASVTNLSQAEARELSRGLNYVS